MSIHSGSMFAATLAAALFAESASAQLVSTRDMIYHPAAGGKPAMIEPRGNISLPADGKIYRVCLDYGTIGTAKFVPSAAADPVVSPHVYICRGSVSPHLAWILDASRGFHPVVLTKDRGNTRWVMRGPQKIIADPPADLTLRARIQVLDGLKWVDVPNADTHQAIQFPKK